MIFSGSRLKTTLDFGHVQLFIQGVRPADSGIYTCKAINKLGEAVSTTSIKVEGKTNVLLKHNLKLTLTKTKVNDGFYETKPNFITNSQN